MTAKQLLASVLIVCTFGLGLRAASQALSNAPASQTPCNADVLKKIEDEKARLSTAIRQATIKLRTDEANKADEKTLAGDRDAQAKAIAEFRQAVAAEIVARQACAPPTQAGQAINDIRQDAENTIARQGQLIDSSVAAAVTNNPGGKVRTLAGEEATYIIARAQLEVAQEAARRLNPVVTNPAPNSTNPWQVANATQQWLKTLLDRIISNKVEEPRLPSWKSFNNKTSAEAEVEEWKRKMQRDADIAEFMRLAEGGLFVDPATGQVITGQLRDRIAKNAKLELAEALRKNGMEAGLIRSLFGWTDSRIDIGVQIEQEVKANNWYQALDYLNPSMSGAGMPQVFHAMAGVLRSSATQIHDWRAGLIPEGGGGGFTGWLYENFWAKQHVGLGTAIKVGGSELNQIDQRIDDFEAQVGAVVNAFNAAANTPDPANLDPASHKLLEGFGYIGKTAAGSEFYKVPTQADLTGALQKNLNLPGASLLDMISAANIIKTILLTAAPEMAAARVGLLLEGLELGGIVVKIGQTGATMLANAGATAIEQKIRVGTVEWDHIALDTVVLTFANIPAGSAASAFGKQTAKLFENEATKHLAEAAVREALGLTSDAAIQTYWNATKNNTHLTYEEFLANAFNSFVGRVSPSAAHAATKGLKSLVTAAAKYARPQWFENAVANDAELSRLDRERQAELVKHIEEATSRVSDVVGDTVTSPQDLATPENVSKITEALETGQVKWSDLKTLYQEMPWLFEPMLRKIVQQRATLAQEMFIQGRQAAIKEINAIADKMVADANKLPEGPQRTNALAEAAAFREREITLAEFDAKAPGSDNVTSDIDRSIKSSYVRNQIKKIADAVLGKWGVPAATTAMAYDLNEYIDVFDIINRQANGANPFGTSFTGPNGRPMTHADAVEAASMAAAMQHMTAGERQKYIDNQLKRTNNDPVMAQKVQYATDSLARGERELNIELARLAKEGVDITSPDAITRARDTLYGQRTKELNDMEAQLEKMDPNSPEAKQLASKIHLGWAFALREGIEAYSDFTGLDVIVQKGQMQKKKMRDMINDPTVTAEFLGVNKQQVTGMLNDQATMIVEHVNAFNEGAENATQTGSALAKYGERTVLALKLRGDNISTGNGKELSVITEKLMKVRDKPTQLSEELAKYDDGNAEVGVKKLANLIATTMPGLEGVFDPRLLHDAANATAPAPGTPAWVNRFLGNAALAREREQERREAQLLGGSNAVAQLIAGDVASMEAELAQLQAEQARDAKLSVDYRKEHFGKVKDAQSAIAAIDLQIAALPLNYGMMTSVHQNLLAQREQFATALANYKGYKQRAPATATEPVTDAEIRRANRIAFLQGAIPKYKADQAKYEAQAKLEASQIASGINNWSPLFMNNNGTPLFGNFDTGLMNPSAKPTFKVNPDGTFTFVPPGGTLTYPGLLMPNGSYELFNPGTTPAPGLPPIYSVPPKPIPINNVHWDPVAGVTFSDPPFYFDLVTALTSTTPPPGGNNVVVPPNASATRIGDGNDLIDLGVFGWGDARNFIPDPTPNKPIIDDTFLPDLTIVERYRSGTFADDGFCCQPRVQVMIGYLPPMLGAPAPEPPSLPFTAGRASQFLAKIAAPPASFTDQRRARSVALFTSTGASQGEAFTVQVVNDDPAFAAFSGSGVVLEPLKISSTGEALRQVQRTAGDDLKKAAVKRIEGYCLNALLDPPAQGMLYRIASQAIQQKFRDVPRVLATADRLAARGLLHPDTDAKAYVESIKQYAAWTLIERWDQKAFGDAWLERTKKTAAAVKQTWTSAMTQAIVNATAGRWRDIQTILTNAKVSANGQ